MIFESLSDRLQATFKKLRGHGKLTEDDVNEAMREVRMALLEADVNFKVVKQFIKTVKERAIGQDILETLTPAQVVIKIVDEELTKLMGGTQSRLNISPKPPTVIMMVGLQGAGKTTSAGKLGLALKKQGKRPLLVAADIYRPAAITQLQVLGKQLDIPVFSMEQGTDAVTIAKSSIGYSQSHACDVVIIDTAGRLQIDEKLMQELRDIKSEVHPHEILLVVDAMTGQESVNVAQAFNDALGLDGVVMTKLDGDARGGAALSVKAVTGVPIKFIGLGEKLEPLEPFHPDRMASRILGMGDVLSLVEKAQATFDMEEAKKMEKKLRKDEFTLDDFLAQMQQVKKLGSLDNILGLIPGMGGLKK
ncbi:signal recognition particle protein, partial [Mitsuokella jalaludinii]